MIPVLRRVKGTGAELEKEPGRPCRAISDVTLSSAFNAPYQPAEFGMIALFAIISVGFRVPAKPLRFEHWGACEDLSLTDHVLKHFAVSKGSSTNSQHKGHKISTGSGHRCGVIPYSSVVWRIACRAEDEQYKG